MFSRNVILLVLLLPPVMFGVLALAVPPVNPKCYESSVGEHHKRTGTCRAYLPIEDTHYMLNEGDVYWVRRTFYEQRECGGGVGSMGNIMRPICWTSKGHTPYQVENRYVFYVAPHSKSFKPLKNTSLDFESWQQEQLTFYAVDAHNVYYAGEKIVRAAPAKFSVVFPFGDEEKWKSLKLSKSGDSSFASGVDIGKVNWSKFTIIEPAPCPSHSPACKRRSLDELLKGGSAGGVYGSVGNDIIYLNAYGGARLKEKFVAGASMFSAGNDTYVCSSGILYTPSADEKELVLADKEHYFKALWFDLACEPNVSPRSE